MAAPLIRVLPLLRHRLHHHHHNHRVATSLLTRRLWSTLAESSPASDNTSGSLSGGQSISRNTGKHHRWDDPDFRKWKNKEAEILKDIDPITSATKKILHSNRYLDGERLTAEDEKLVVKRLLAYHPHCEDKIGSGIDSIMVDRHPQFRRSRCLFVIRTDGGWIDFSYQKCLRAYIREKYRSHAERFIKEHFKRGSG